MRPNEGLDVYCVRRRRVPLHDLAFERLEALERVSEQNRLKTVPVDRIQGSEEPDLETEPFEVVGAHVREEGGHPGHRGAQCDRTPQSQRPERRTVPERELKRQADVYEMMIVNHGVLSNRCGLCSPLKLEKYQSRSRC